MEVSLAQFLDQVSTNPIMAISVLLTLGVIFVNGWTDAPNAIATCVTTRCMPARAAILMSAAFNFLGVLIMTHFNASVANTISHIVDFGGNSTMALACLCAALFSIVVYGATASRFGIPTSQSHSLIAGLTGAAIALGGASSVNVHEWMKVIYGLALSIGLGFVMGWVLCKLVSILFAAANRRRANVFFKYAQIASAAAMSFMHGAQDGQKFIGVLLFRRGLLPAASPTSSAMPGIPMWIMLLCSAAHGRRHQRGRRDASSSPSAMEHGQARKVPGLLRRPRRRLLQTCCSPPCTGIPVSTTHTKTSAIMGVGAVKRLSAINFSVVKDMLLTWVFTFPGCGAISFVMAKLFMMLF